ALRHRNQITTLIDTRIQRPTNREVLTPEENDLVRLSQLEGPAGADARALLALVERARRDHTNVGILLTIREESHFWTDRAIAVMDLTVSGRPTRGTRQRDPVTLARGARVARMRLVLEGDQWKPVAFNIDWDELRQSGSTP
ncbi:MAG: hypothetical protein KF858_01835, partial [Candidatus Sumerlaeia bacterium]|nr:hypothetical protein [Candidatus Sumerlaeia bacterium]